MRFKSLFLACLLMLVSTLPAMAVGPTLNLNTVSGTPGNLVTVTATLAGGGGTIAALAMNIDYDQTKLSNPIADTSTGTVKWAIAENITSPGHYTIGLTRSQKDPATGLPYAIPDGDVFTVTFTVAGTASGNATLNNTPSGADRSAAPVALTGTNGQVTLPVILPIITSFTIPATGTSLAVTFTTLTGSANTAAYLVSESATKPTAGDANWKTTKPASYTFNTYGAKTLYAWAKDADGNISAAAVTAATTLTEPLASVTAFTIPATSYSLDITPITFTASSNAVAFLITESATAPAASAITAPSAPTSFTVTGFTTHTLYAWVKNVSGVVSAPFAGQLTTVSEKPAPVLTVTAPADNTTVTKNNTIVVTGTAVKNSAVGSGDVASVTVNGVNVGTLGTGGEFAYTLTFTDGDGAKTITIVASDNQVTPVTATVTRTVTKDTAVPTLTVTSPADGLKTKETPLNIAGTVTDANGIKSLTVNDSTVTVGANGTFTYPLALTTEGPVAINVVATDNADNATTVTRNITYDKTPMTLTVSTPAANSQTKDSSVTVTGTISEAGGTVEIKNTTSNITVAATVTDLGYTGLIQIVEGANDIQVTVTDQAGNISTAVSRAITLDTIAPALAITTPNHDIQVQVAAGAETVTINIAGTTDTTATEVSLSFGGDAPITQDIMTTPGTFTYTKTIPRPALDAAYQVVATAKDVLTNTATVTRNIVYTQTPGDILEPGIIKIVEALKAFLYFVDPTAFPISDPTEKAKLDCVPLNAPDGKIDAGDVIFLLRRAAD